MPLKDLRDSPVSGASAPSLEHFERALELFQLGRGDPLAALRLAIAEAPTRLVGLPACRAIQAFGRGRYAEAQRLLEQLPTIAHRIGGSQAQRDVLELTRAAARPLEPSPRGSPAHGRWPSVRVTS